MHTRARNSTRSDIQFSSGLIFKAVPGAQVITWASFVHKSCRSSRFATGPESNVSHREFNLPHQSGVKLKVLITVFRPGHHRAHTIIITMWLG